MWMDLSEGMNFVVHEPVELFKMSNNSSGYVLVLGSVFISSSHASDHPCCFEQLQLLSFYMLLSLSHCHPTLITIIEHYFVVRSS